MARRNEATIEFDAISIEGGLLPPEWLGRVAALEAGAQSPVDYGIKKGLQLRDEITRNWRMAEALWAEFASARVQQGHAADAVTQAFVRQLLVDVFGFADLAAAGARVVGDRSFPIGFEGLGGRVPVVVATASEGLDDSVVRHGDGARRRSAWGALQEYLNASDGVLWGVACNGYRIRLGRDNASLTRPAWLEGDLERIFTEERFADFSVLWLVLHASRFGRADQAPEEAPLEAWRAQARERGSRARAQLRTGVEAALGELGQGFVAHPANADLRALLAAGTLTPQEYFNELLRLVYRVIFLLTLEEREILHPADAGEEARRLYAEGYGLRRLRERAVRRAGFDRHTDQWASLRPVFSALGRPGGEPALGLRGLGGLFASDQCPHLDAAEIENRALLTALFRLAWIREGGALARVNWRDMGPEELGSVYESLLELVPLVSDEGRRFAFAGADESAGNARKLTGSYYTPDELVQELLDSALEPVVAERLAAHPDDAVGTLLSLSVIDPACGSGHFLLAAARRLATHLARARSGGTPGAAEYRHALRDVVTHCIHGVDRNPMALELARMALWLETYTPDRALGFLDHHLVCGDALLGLLDPGVLQDGIPDDAFKPLTGDDKDVVKTLRKLNRDGLKALQQRKKKDALSLQLGTQSLAQAFEGLEALGDERIESVEQKRARYAELRAEAERSPVAVAADLFLAAFLMPKRLAPGERALTETVARERFPTTGTLTMALEGMLAPEHSLVCTARDTCRELRVLHWRLAFPQVFEKGGFDVVLGNPPWEVSQLSEEEFFASRAADIAQLAGARRKAAIVALEREQPHLWEAFMEEKFRFESSNSTFRVNPRFRLTAVGKLNTYPLFAETAYRMVGSSGRAGLVLPTGIATDDSTKAFFGKVAQGGRLVSLYDFENRDAIFPGVHRSYKFCLLTLGRATETDFAFFITQVSQLSDARRRFRLSPADFRLINPNTRTCPVFRSQADAELTKKIYRNVPVLIDETKPAEEGNPWKVSFSQGLFNMTSASHLFLDAPMTGALPLYEAKMIHQFDHRWATYSANGGEDSARDMTVAEKADPRATVRPRYWLPYAAVQRRAARVPDALWKAVDDANEAAASRIIEQWFAGFHLNRGDEARGRELLYRGSGVPQSEDRAEERSAVARALEQKYPLVADDEVLIQQCTSNLEAAEALIDVKMPRWLMGWRDICRATDERTVIASAMPLAAVGHTIPLFINSRSAPLQALLLANLCSMSLDFAARQKVGGTHLTYGVLKQFPLLPPDAYGKENLDFILPRVLELTYTADDLTLWARDLGYNGATFPWNPERRGVLRAELDAYYAHLYGLTRDELRYILDPADVMGPDYPSETFRVLKNNEMREFGEYRSRRLVLEAWDALTAGRMLPSQASEVLVPLQRALPARPTLDASLDASLAVLALVWARGGSIDPGVLARAFALRSQPSLLVQFAPTSLATAARAWVESAGIPGMATARQIVGTLVERDALRWISAGETDMWIATSPHTPGEAQLAEWFRYEARLLLAVVDALPPVSIDALDAELSVNDHSPIQVRTA